MDAQMRARLKREVDRIRRDQLRQTGVAYACDIHDSFVRHCAGCGQRRRKLMKHERID